MECYNFQYAVKFMCGQWESEALAPGKYFTAINVHNPTDGDVIFRYKVAVALSPGEQGPKSDFAYLPLGSDLALEIDCPVIMDILRKIPYEKEFAKGFVVIETDVELDVVAVYTAAGGRERQVVSIHMERVAPRRPIRLPHFDSRPDQG